MDVISKYPMILDIFDILNFWGLLAYSGFSGYNGCENEWCKICRLCSQRQSCHLSELGEGRSKLATLLLGLYSSVNWASW